MMTHDAYRKGVITVNGGDQIRTHVHIDDLCDFYRLALKKGEAGKTYDVWNIGCTIKAAAETIAENFKGKKRPVSIEVRPRSDTRSYGADLTGDSMRSIGAVNKRAVWDGVRDLIIKFDSGYWPDSQTNEIYQNIATGLK